MPCRVSPKSSGTISASRRGAIAQLGERLVCNQKVAGSIPAGSTTLPQPAVEHQHDDATTRDDASPPPRAGSPDRALVPGRFAAADPRVCSLTFRLVLILTLSFQASDLILILELENVAFAM